MSAPSSMLTYCYAEFVFIWYIVALAVLHARVSTQLCCDWVSRVVFDWVVK